MDTEQLAQYENRLGSIRLDEMSFAVKVKRARVRFGHLDLLVMPTDGTGEKWVEHHKVTLS